MTSPIAPSGARPVDAGVLRPAGTDSAPPTSKAAAHPARPDVASTSARIAGQGAPVDASRVATIRAAIASGRYRPDADAIAARMMALDLPQ